MLDDLETSNENLKNKLHRLREELSETKRLLIEQDKGEERITSLSTNLSQQEQTQSICTLNYGALQKSWTRKNLSLQSPNQIVSCELRLCFQSAGNVQKVTLCEATSSSLATCLWNTFSIGTTRKHFVKQQMGI